MALKLLLRRHLHTRRGIVPRELLPLYKSPPLRSMLARPELPPLPPYVGRQGPDVTHLCVRPKRARPLKAMRIWRPHMRKTHLLLQNGRRHVRLHLKRLPKNGGEVGVELLQHNGPTSMELSWFSGPSGRVTSFDVIPLPSYRCSSGVTSAPQ